MNPDRGVHERSRGARPRGGAVGTNLAGLERSDPRGFSRAGLTPALPAASCRWGGVKPRDVRYAPNGDRIRQRRGVIVIRFYSTRVILVVGALALVLQAGPARAEGGANEAGLGVASAAASLIYGPTKIVYSLLGVIFGGFAYGLSGGDSSVMSAVVTPAIRGDYVVTPMHLRGERPLEFFGRDPGYREDDVVLEDIY